MKVKRFLKCKWVAHSFIAGALVLLLLFISLPGCAPEEYEEYVASLAEGNLPVPRECFEQAVEEGELCVWEWAEWWPEWIFSDFEEKFGIDITRDYFASSDEVEAKFSLDPQTPYDLVTGMGVMTIYRFKAMGAAGELNHDWLPNMIEYLPEEYLDPEYDPGMKYGAPRYMYFATYFYNTELVDDPRIPSLSVLFEPMDEFKGRIILLDDMGTAIGAALKYLGYNFYSVNEAELMEARDLLMELKPHIMAFDSWPHASVLADEALICQNWYGDGWFFHSEYEAIMPVVSLEGGELGIGIDLHPIASPNPAAAHLFLNYLFRPEVYAGFIQTIYHSPIHTGLEGILSEGFQERMILPEGYLDKCDPYDPRSETGRGLELRLEIWEDVRG